MIEVGRRRAAGRRQNAMLAGEADGVRIGLRGRVAAGEANIEHVAQGLVAQVDGSLDGLPGDQRAVAAHIHRRRPVAILAVARLEREMDPAKFLDRRLGERRTGFLFLLRQPVIGEAKSVSGKLPLRLAGRAELPGRSPRNHQSRWTGRGLVRCNICTTPRWSLMCRTAHALPLSCKPNSWCTLPASVGHRA